MRRYATLLAVLCMLPVALYAGERAPELRQMVERAASSVEVISMQAFREVVKHPAEAMIIDVREAHEYQSGHVPGAINIPRGLIEFKIWKLLGYPAPVDKGKKIYLYCQQGERSLLSASALRQLGFTNVTAVDMTIAGWEEAGYPLDF